MLSNFAHPIEVLSFVVNCQDLGERCALVVVTGTEGGGVRAPGALMGVSESGAAAGYVSNGCVDANLIINARQAIKENTVQHVRYGAGSPFFDIKLPCGGGLDLVIFPNPHKENIRNVVDILSRRHPIGLRFSKKEGFLPAPSLPPSTRWAGDGFEIRCVPKIKLRIAGRGVEPIALARLAKAVDMEVLVQSPDASCLANAEALGVEFVALTTPEDAPRQRDDPWTAFVLMFHEHEWEVGLLCEALAGDAFFIGALGSRTTHLARCEALAAAGLGKAQIERVYGPIGLIPAMRDASMLAISALAQVVSVYQQGVK